MSQDGTVSIPVIAAIDGYVLERECEIEPGKTTVQEALDRTAVLKWLSIRNLDGIGYGSFGRALKTDDVLGAHDRLEIFQRLTIDPTHRRRLQGLEEAKARRPKKRGRDASGTNDAGNAGA